MDAPELGVVPLDLVVEREAVPRLVALALSHLRERAQEHGALDVYAAEFDDVVSAERGRLSARAARAR